MNGLTIDECFAARDYERKQTAKLEAKLASAIKSRNVHKAGEATLKHNNAVLTKRLEKLGAEKDALTSQPAGE